MARKCIHARLTLKRNCYHSLYDLTHRDIVLVLASNGGRERAFVAGKNLRNQVHRRQIVLKQLIREKMESAREAAVFENGFV